MELFRVISVIDNLSHGHHRYNQVKVHWFVIDRRFPVVSYKKIVGGFEDLPEKDKAFAREYAKELFTAKESAQLKDYLKCAHGCLAEITSLTLPTEDRLGFRAHTVVGTTGFFKLKDEADNALPFKVWGYFDVAGLQPIGGFANIIRDFITTVRIRVSGLMGRSVRE